MYENPEQTRTQRSGFIGWCARHPKLVVAMGLVLLLVGTCAVADRRATQSFQNALDSLREEGGPVTLADLNAMGGDIPDDENMAIPLLVAAEKLCSVDIPPERNSKLPLIGTRLLPPVGQHMPEEHRDATDWYLMQQVDSLEAAHETMVFERGHFPVRWTTPAIDVSLDFVSPVRQLVRAWVLQAVVAAEDGRPADAMAIIDDMLRLDRAFEGNASLLEVLVRVTCRMSALMAIENLLGHCELDHASLAAVAGRLAEDELRINFREALEVERVLTLDMIEAVFAGKSPGRPGSSPPPVLAYVPLLRSFGNAKGLEAYSELVKAIGEPNRETLHRLESATKRMDALPPHCILWKLATPSAGSACSLWLLSVANNRAMQVVIACERYRLVRGDWPNVLEDLVPKYLPAVPLDPFDDQPIRYKRIEGGILVWSIGRNMADDHGDVRWTEGRKRNDSLKDTGGVLLDPQHRGKTP